MLTELDTSARFCQKRAQRFQHPVILAGVADHLRAVQQIPSHGYPYGALLLACVAVCLPAVRS